MANQILLIDDDEGARRITQFSLEAATGWEVLTAASGAEGIAIATAQSPDAILLDVMMPDLDGPATFQQLQENPLTQSIPVILLTAKASLAEQKPLAELGVAGIITKPYKIPTLVAQIRQILDWHDYS